MALLVNGERIENAALDEERRALRIALAEKMADEPVSEIEERAREWSRENVIERVLLRQAALRDPEPISAEAIESVAGSDCDADTRKEVEVRLRTERLIARLTSHAARPRRKDVVEYYKKNATNFEAAEAIHAGHIVKNVDQDMSEEAARDAMEQIRLTLQAGKPFEELADESSDCPGRGGDLGFFPRGEMVDEFDSVAFALSPGEVSGVVRTPFGFHIIKVYNRRAKGVLPLDAVSNDIEELLFAQKKQKIIDLHLDSLRAKAEIREAP